MGIQTLPTHRVLGIQSGSITRHVGLHGSVTIWPLPDRRTNILRKIIGLMLHKRRKYICNAPVLRTISY